MPSQDSQGRKRLHIVPIVATLPITGVEGHYRFFRKHLYRFLDVLVATTVGFQIQNAVVWVARMAVSPETVGHMHHAQRQIRRLDDSGGGHGHKVFQAPVLFGIPKVQLDVEPQTIIVHQ